MIKDKVARKEYYRKYREKNKERLSLYFKEYAKKNMSKTMAGHILI